MSLVMNQLQISFSMSHQNATHPSFYLATYLPHYMCVGLGNNKQTYIEHIVIQISTELFFS